MRRIRTTRSQRFGGWGKHNHAHVGKPAKADVDNKACDYVCQTCLFAVVSCDCEDEKRQYCTKCGGSGWVLQYE